MKRNFINRSAAKKLLEFAFVASLVFPCIAQAASVVLATQPLGTVTATNVKPNIMFILDDSGSMDWDYLPDWANDSDPVLSTNYTEMPELFRNNGFNGVAYNPAITYAPPVLFDTAGNLDSSTYPNIGSPWTAVKNDAYGKQSTATTNLTGSTATISVNNGAKTSTSVTSITVGGVQILSGTAGPQNSNSNLASDIAARINDCSSVAIGTCGVAGFKATVNGNTVVVNSPSQISDTPVISVSGGRTVTSTPFSIFATYYTFIPGEYCSSDRMTSCVVATAPTSVTGVTYDKPAGLRWCDSAALTNCQSINNSTFKFPRYPGRSLTVAAVPAARPTALIIFSGTTANTNPGSVLSASLAGPASVKLGTTIAKSTNITIGKNASASTAATAVAAAIGTAGTIAAYVGGNTVTPTCAAATNKTVCLVDTSGYTNGNSVTLGTISLPGTLTATLVASAGGTAGTPGGTVLIPGTNQLTVLNPATTTYNYPGTAGKAGTRTDCAGTSCTYAEEMTNFANWWTYYHTRLQAMKTSVSRSFKGIDARYRVGFSTISDKTTVNSSTFLGNNTFETTHKNSWFTKLFGSVVASSTPLRGAISKAGRYYGHKFTGASDAPDPMQYSCQQNFTILSTDGYWNSNDEIPKSDSCSAGSGASTDYGPFQLDNLTCVGDLDSDSGTRPLYEGPTATSSSLADVAKYYYDTDLRTTNCTGASSPDFPSGNPDVCSNNVFTSATDNNKKQHMTTFTMGLGADGTLNYTSDYDTATSGDFYDLKNGLNSVNWPDSINKSAGERIDDLWHAAVDGHGLYFSAKNPDQIVAGFTKALSSIATKLGAGSAAATSTLNPVSGNNYAFVASYTTIKWTGNLEARTINTSNGVVSTTATWCVETIPAPSCLLPGTVVADTSGSSTVYNCVVTGATAGSCTSPSVFDAITSTCKTPIANACTGTMPAKVGAASDSRTIYSVSGGTMVPFTSANFASNSNFSAAHISGLNQWGTLNAAQKSAAAGANLVNFLRGQNGYEDRSSNTPLNRLYRAREATLGDPLESQPAYIASPTFSYTYPGYQAFRSSNATRPGTVYMGVNDGMLHAIDGTNGNERWAFIPSMVIPNLWKLASNSYGNNHANFVNGSPAISDIYCTSCGLLGTAAWRTILVGGLNGGGRGYYALDITDPTTPSLLWEFNTTNAAPYGDPDLGYSFGIPVITRKKDGTWVVLVTSGYDNGTLSADGVTSNSPAGSGEGFLYVLDASTGAILNKIGTGTGTAADPSGLAQIAVWNDAPGGNEAGFVYGGDLQGNLWRFDINTLTSPIAIATFGATQPVTTAPTLGLVDGTHHVVYVGTGKYLEASDLANKDLQSFYAIKDDGTAIGNPRTHTTGADMMVQQTIGSSNTVNFNTDRGWFVDFPNVGTGSERQNIDSRLVSGILIVPTLVPASTICSPGGYGNLYYFDYTNGVGTVQKVDATIVGINVIYLKKPIVEIVTSIDPTPSLPDVSPTFGNKYQGFQKTKTIWRELIPGQK